MTGPSSEPTTTGVPKDHQPGRQPTRGSAISRYGPLVAIVVVVAVIGALVVLRGRAQEASSGGAAAGSRTPGSEVSPGAARTGAPVTFAAAAADGRADQIDWVANCDRRTGRIRMPSIYAPPCVPAFHGDNGGATAPGVTADEVKVVVYQPTPDADLASLLTGLGDSDEATAETTRRFVEMADDLYETYGRKVTFVPLAASGSDPTAAAADAVRVIEEIKPFASLGGPLGTTAYAEALADAGILCIECGAAQPDSFAQANAPHIWGSSASPEEFLTTVEDYVAGRLAGRRAAFAGPELAGRERAFGIVHFEQDPPVFGPLAEQFSERAGREGFRVAATASYVFDIGKMPQRATEIVARMKDAGATSIVFVGDPVMPLYLTRAATAQGYFPEWIVTGTVGTDTTVAGRFYDPEQMRHAFGLSTLAVRLPPDQGESWRLHEWYVGAPPAATNTQGLIWGPIAFLYTGLHLAGPALTVENFAAGLFAMPPAGGGPTAPRESYGDHGLFRFPDGSPRPDYFGTDDVTEIWWDVEAQGPDEQGKPGRGMWRYVDGGRRYLPGTLPRSEPVAFRTDGSVTLLDRPPPSDVPPDYPPPPGAPALAGR